MANLSKFGNTGEEQMDEFTPLAPGQYIAAVIKSEVKRNSKDTGSYLKLQFQIKEGEYKGRMLFSTLNLDHPSADAVAMARKEWNSVKAAAGLVHCEESEEVHGIEMELTVVKKAATANYAAGNEIKGYTRLQGSSAPSSPKPSDGDEKPKSKKKVSFD